MRLLVALLPLLLLAALRAQSPHLTSSSVADAAEKLTGRPAHMGNEIRLLTGQRLSGPAVTLRLVRDDRSSALEAGLAAIQLLESAPAGFVVDGSVHDLHDLNRLDAVNAPVLCGGIPVNPGDHIVADEDGVAVIPQARYNEVLPIARKVQADKQALLPLLEKHATPYLASVAARGPRCERRGVASEILLLVVNHVPYRLLLSPGTLTARFVSSS